MTAVGARYTGDFGTLLIQREYIEKPTNGVRVEYMSTGEVSYWLNDKPISRDEAQRVIDEWHRRRTPTA
jgi:hypothetical protein